MGLDIKIPIGAMFLIFGIILGIFGLTTQGNAIYASSLDINVNLWSGAFMFVFGIIMLLLSSLVKKGKVTKEYGIAEEETKL